MVYHAGMFTGLVEGQAHIAALESEPPNMRLVLDPPELESRSPADVPRLGDSIAINGCCLTIVSLDDGRWAFEAGEETLSRTNLGTLAIGDAVNIERSLAADARLGGHFVTGHVDCLGRVAAIDRDGDWVRMRFALPDGHIRGLVEKGSVAIDGISLTVCQVTPEEFDVALIPHTLDVTTLGQRAVGDAVNIETDLLGKYVAKMVGASGAGSEGERPA